ncbi:uncharacterized protein VP01_3329g2 [Puccinia sorghi]|uniref:Uncharacterized protein n=1 Tax=Puccinia sorghi TaxID=27349 RepID=A0A0L6UX81_9BASI|nr:uncharacterized protein VP01_3329g2 [Puccinia sorghi]
MTKPDILLFDDQAESDWTQLSIPSIASRSTTNETGPSSSTTARLAHHQQPAASSSSSSGSMIKSPGASDFLSTQLLPPEHSNRSLEESDSSTNFDPQAWKRGDEGVRKARIHVGEAASRRPEQSQNINSRSRSSSSFFFDAAFIPPQVISSTGPETTQRRRAISNSRKILRPNSLTTSGTHTSGHSTSHTRPSSDLGPPSKLSAVRGKRSSAPTWRAYTGRESSASCSTTRTGDQKQEFLQAISNLQVMAKMGKFEWLSASSNGAEEDQDADEPRPGHADLPTSTFNSAVGEDDDEASHPLQPIPPSQPHPHDPHNHASLFSRLRSYIGRAISLKTWQFLGLGGIIFGFGICAG